MKVNPNAFIHEDDRTAMEALKAIPGFTPFLKAFMKVWDERKDHIINLSTNLRVDDKQLKMYNDMLIPICKKLGIDVPELYIELDVNPNAATWGDTKPYIVITSGMLDTVPDELIPTVLAHECGHIACHHALYTTMGNVILNSASYLPGLASLVTAPLQMAFYYWMRCSEFSADRAAVVCDGTWENMAKVCMYLAGYNKGYINSSTLNAFMEQAADYREEVEDDKWDKTLEFMVTYRRSHPLNAVRAYECREWANSEQYSKTLRYLGGDLLALGDLEESTREIPMAESSKFYLGKDYNDVRDALIDEGFSDIQAVKSTDKKFRTKMDQTLKIQINEDESFDKGAWYPEDATIILTYYGIETPEEIAASHEGKLQVPDGSKKYIGRNYQEVINELGDAGFSAFIPETQEVEKSKRMKENAIVKIAISGQTQFNKGDWFNQDAKIRITYQVIKTDESDNW